MNSKFDVSKNFKTRQLIKATQSHIDQSNKLSRLYLSFTIDASIDIDNDKNEKKIEKKN